MRPIAPGEVGAFIRARNRAFGAHTSEEDIRRTTPTIEPQRALAVIDEGQIVGTTAARSLEMAVPGGSLPAAGIIHVSVQPTHRRRGIFARMTRRQLRDIHDGPEPIAILWAAESSIYGRFGFGMACFHESWRIERQHSALANPPEQQGRVRFVEPDEAKTLFPDVYERVWQARSGMIKRNTVHWDSRLRDTERDRGGASAFFHAVHEADDRLDGYVLYRIDGGKGALVVHELIAATDEAYATLWQFCFGVDLITSTEAQGQPVDAPLMWMLSDPRRLRRTPGDAIWLRLIDVPAALSGRRYAQEERLTIEVTDPACPWNEGRFELDAGPDGAECRPTRKEPELLLSAEDLAALYLGAVRCSTLAHAGRVKAHTPAALSRADATFTTEIQPWCGDYFFR